MFDDTFMGLAWFLTTLENETNPTDIETICPHCACVLFIDDAKEEELYECQSCTKQFTVSLGE